MKMLIAVCNDLGLSISGGTNKPPWGSEVNGVWIDLPFTWERYLVTTAMEAYQLALELKTIIERGK